MNNNKAASRAFLLATACSGALFAGPAMATDTVVANGATSSTPITMTGADTLTVQSNGTATNGPGGFGPVVITGNATGSGIAVTNNGTMSNTKTGPAAPIVAGGNTYILNGFPTITAGGAFSGIFNFNNTGVITSTQGPTVFLAPLTGDITINNSGVIIPGGGYLKNGVAQGQTGKVAIAFGSGTNVLTNTASGNIAGDVILGSGTNTVNIQAGGLISGGIYGQSSGTNVINLTGPGAGNAYGQSTAGFQGWNNINTLNVISGNWTLTGGGYYNNLNIAQGAVFNICDISAATVGQCSNRLNGTPSDGGIGALTGTTLNVALNGLMISQSNDGRIYYDPTAVGELKITGKGNFLFQNAAGTGGYVGPADNLSGFAGTTTVDGGAFILGTTIGGNVVINPKGTLQIGSGGNLKNINGQNVDNGKVGNVLGNIVDNGTLIFNRLDDFTYAGNLSGNGNIIKKNSDTVTLSGQYTYTGKTQIQGGAIVLASTAKLSTASALDVSGGSINLNGTSQTVAGLSSTDGKTGTLNVGGGSLTVTQTENSSFGGTLAGTGAITKTGSGTLVLTGNDSGYTGSTTITGGLLEVGDAANPTASLGGSITVAAGGALGGHGTINGSVSNAGTLKPGGSIGTLHVGGDYTFASGAALEEEIAANGTADLTQAGGKVTIGDNTALLVQPTDPVSSYAPSTTYTIITGGTGVSGTFASVTSSITGVTPVVIYGPNAVTLSLVRNDINLAPQATSTNQVGVARALSTGKGGQLYVNIVMNGPAAAPQALDALSGEVHATVAATLLNDNGFFSDLVESRTRSTDAGLRVWGGANGRWTKFHGSADAAAARNSRSGYGAGADLPVFGNVRLGAAFGYSSDNLTVAQRQSAGRVSSLYGGIYGDLSDGPLSATAGFVYATHNIGTSRQVAFAGVTESETADYNAHSLLSFAEVRYRIGDLTEGLYAEPFGGVTGGKLSTGGFGESGGLAALAGTAAKRDALFTKLGSRLGKDYSIQDALVSPQISLAWEHAAGNLTARENLSFAGGSLFSVSGAPIGRDDLAVQAGVGVASGPIGLNVFYAGRIGSSVTEHSVNVALRASL